MIVMSAENVVMLGIVAGLIVLGFIAIGVHYWNKNRGD
jgi:hypothetical protein